MSDNLKFSTLGRILIYLVILLICSLIGVAFTFLMLLAGDTGLLLGQGISSILIFIVPPIVYYYVTRKQNPVAALGLRSVNRPWGFYILIGVVLMFASLPATNQLTEWNEGMSFGPAFAKLEEYLKTMEEAAAEVTERMLNVDTVGGLLLNLFVIALIPAIGEELTFRGLLQQSLTRSMKNPHVAIILTGAIFSFIHFQFYGFLFGNFTGLYVLHQRFAVDEYGDALRQQRHSGGGLLPQPQRHHRRRCGPFRCNVVRNGGIEYCCDCGAHRLELAHEPKKKGTVKPQSLSFPLI